MNTPNLDAPNERDPAVYQYLPLYKAPRPPDGHQRNFKSFAPKDPPPLTKSMDEFWQCLDRITSTTMLALSDLFYVIREIRPRISWIWRAGGHAPDLCAVDKLHWTYLNLLAAMDTVHFACAKYFLALRANSESATSYDAVNACKCVAEHIVLVTERWDHAAADLLEYLPLRPLERLEHLFSGLSVANDRYPTHRNKVLSVLPSLRVSAHSQAAVLKDLYEELEKAILLIEADGRAADLPHANLNVALAALIWHEWGLAQYREDMHFARRWDGGGGGPSDYDTTQLINECRLAEHGVQE
ncbi:hypothetical protein FB45DRAFT_1053605 [Roridomyces roridus]|uniref:Uncharacterized protein n=1 Tax=Roridomyces roridus TaxID=1738132 RepID=A0AAD7FVS4_9AGAR|nr:hypothetical protein FB45DRAFT_1053605 [Roridomyces roridus]